MDEYITLADGTVVENAHILDAGGSIIVYVYGGKSLGWMYRTFSVKTKTETIVATRGGAETTWSGNTELFAVRVENKRLSTACLRKETNDNA